MLAGFIDRFLPLSNDIAIGIRGRDREGLRRKILQSSTGGGKAQKPERAAAGLLSVP